jgi:hypothetical protein
MPTAPKRASRRRVAAPDPVFETGRKPVAKAAARKAAPVAAPKAREQRPASKKKAAPPPPVQPTSNKFLVRPLPLRVTQAQLDALYAKKDMTGVPVQELIRRAIDHMLATHAEDVVPNAAQR